MLNINFKAIAKIIGVLLCIEAIFMLIPLFTSIYYHEKDTMPFLYSFLITAVIGGLILMSSKRNNERTGKREGFMAVTLSWISISLMGALPFIFNGDTHNFTDAFFESMSGFSTTGMSILEDIDGSCHGILLWRSLSQWLGGMGIILFSLAILPILNYGSGLYLFSAEMTGVTHEKLGPRISQTAKKLWGLYLFFTILLFVLLVVGPMDTFDAICTAMTTYSAGGFSTKQESIAYWDSAYIDYTITFFMFLSGINFALIYRSAFRSPKYLFKNEELKYYFYAVVIGTIIIALYLLFSYGSNISDYEWSFRTALFTVVSGLTTTGYSIVDFCDWGSFFFFIICLCMLCGACAGSTSGGAKMIRTIILMKNTSAEFFRQIHPNAIRPIRVNNSIVSHEIVSKALAFFVFYVLIILASCVALSLLGLNIEESIGLAISSVSNCGFGVGGENPDAIFTTLPQIGKWIVLFNMLAGRLEIFTLIILFSPYFWKQ